MTNFEKIKAMTIEELAEYIMDREENCYLQCPASRMISCSINCYNAMQEWLQQEVDDDEE